MNSFIKLAFNKIKNENIGVQTINKSSSKNTPEAKFNAYIKNMPIDLEYSTVDGTPYYDENGDAVGIFNGEKVKILNRDNWLNLKFNKSQYKPGSTQKYGIMAELPNGEIVYTSAGSIYKPHSKVSGSDNVLKIGGNAYNPNTLDLAGRAFKNINELASKIKSELNLTYCAEKYQNINDLIIRILDTYIDNNGNAGMNMDIIGEVDNISITDLNTLSVSFGEVVSACYFLTARDKQFNSDYIYFPDAANQSLYDFEANSEINGEMLISVKLMGSGGAPSLKGLISTINKMQRGDELELNSKNIEELKDFVRSHESDFEYGKEISDIINLVTVKNERSVYQANLYAFNEMFPGLGKKIINYLNDADISTYYLNDFTQDEFNKWIIGIDNFEDFEKAISYVIENILNINFKFKDLKQLFNNHNSGKIKTNGYIWYPVAKKIVNTLNSDQNYINALNELTNSLTSVYQCNVKITDKKVLMELRGFSSAQTNFIFNADSGANMPFNKSIGFKMV